MTLRIQRLWSRRDILLLAVFLMALSAALVWLEERPSYQESQRRRLSLQLQEASSSSQQWQTFKILQLADLHFGENPDSDWGPEQDRKSLKVLDAVIPLEQPDLIVLSGDQITANNIDENATAVYRVLADKLQTYQIPWAMVFGNHDDAPLERDDPDQDGNIIFTPAKTSREDLFHVDHSYAPLSLTKKGPQSLFGTSNYILDVYYSGNSKVALQLAFFDSGGGTLPQQIEANQVEWFQQQRRKNNNHDIPMVAFQHIPTKEFTYDGGICQGMQDDGVGALPQDSNIVNALAEDGNVHFLGVGHQHGNDYCCSYKEQESQNENDDDDDIGDDDGGDASPSMHVCFGRHSGYGGYGSWDRGVRVYELGLSAGGSGKDDTNEQVADADEGQESTFRWKSWVRMESGDVQDTYIPFENYNDDEEGE